MALLSDPRRYVSVEEQKWKRAQDDAGTII